MLEECGFESGVIWWYLAENRGNLNPAIRAGRLEALQWLMFQMAGIGPMPGPAHHLCNDAPERLQYAYDRYTTEAGRPQQGSLENHVWCQTIRKALIAFVYLAKHDGETRFSQTGWR
jgi:glutathione S-transferase